MPRRYLPALATFLVLAIAACDEGAVPTGVAGSVAATDAPVVASITLTEQGSGLILLKATAKDPKNRPIAFKWTVDGGNLASSTSAQVFWKVPTAAGAYTATVVVTNDQGVTATASQRFTVNDQGAVAAQGNLEVRAATQTTPGSINSGGFTIPSPVGGTSNPNIVPGNPQAPPPSVPPPSPPLSQPVSTPNPATPLPGPGPGQPIATPPPTTPPPVTVQSPAPLPSAKTPEPGVPVRPKEFWYPYEAAKIPLSDNWNAVHMTGPTRAWIGGGANVLLYDKTGDAEPQLQVRSNGIPVGFNIAQIHFVSDTVGYIAGGGGVMRTRDAGVTWEDITPPAPTILSKVSAMVVANEQIMTIGDQVGNVYRNETLNAASAENVRNGWVSMGSKPVARPLDSARQLYAGAGLRTDATVAYFVGDAIYRLDADAADDQRWRRIASLSNDGVVSDQSALSIKATASEVWVGTFGGALYRIKNAQSATPDAPLRLTRDKYRNREDNGNGEFLGSVSNIQALAVLDANNAFIGVSNGTIDTTNAAESWRRLNVLGAGFNALDVNYATRLDGSTGFLGFGVGSGGVIYQYKPGAI